MKKIICLLMLATCLTEISAKDKTTVSIVEVNKDADAANGGLIYSLPQTVVRIKLTARVVVQTAGPFYKYSTRYLNMTDVVTANSMKWQMVSAEVSSKGIADPAKRYKISSEQASQLPFVCTDTDGKILAFNKQIKNHRKHRKERYEATPTYFDMSKISLPGQVLQRTSTASMAEECANVIYSLREARIDLISGDKETRLPDAGAYKTALDRLDKEEADLVSLFAGRRDTLYISRIVEIVPDYAGSDSNVPVRFSETTGFVDAMDLSGKPIYVDMTFDDTNKVSVYAEGSKQRKSAPIGGLQYYIPSNLTIKVLDRNHLLTEARIRCTQNAQIATLPTEYAAEKEVIFDPTTGAIVSVGTKGEKEELPKGKK